MIDLARRYLDGFLGALADRGVAQALARRLDFLKALTLSELTSIGDLYWMARVTLVGGVDEIAIFDEVFAAWFHSAEEAREEAADWPEDSSSSQAPDGAPGEPPPAVEAGEGSGREASPDEFLLRRSLPHTEPDKLDLCRLIRQAAAAGLPRERSRRLVRSRRRGRLDLRRVLADMRRSGGEAIMLFYRRRPPRVRRLLILVDVSGSLKSTSPDALRFAHALTKAAPRSEVFTFGTRLTRITRALRPNDVDDALRRVGDITFDLEGGTRIGPSLQAFLGDSRYEAMARGALTIVVSDGLERGEVEAMRQATERLARLAHRLVWLTPLRGDPTYRPATRGMSAILPSLDRLGDASSLGALTNEIVGLQQDVERRPRRGVRKQWADPALPGLRQANARPSRRMR
ncbi:MAG TPA: VWA domain-containing protein [Roseiarcus sp.]|jgi:hypothetical protein